MRRLIALGSLLALVGVVADRVLARVAGEGPVIRMLSVVNAPIQETWSVLADVPLQVEWMREMKSMTITTPGPIGVGTRGTAVVRIFGIPAPDPVEIVEYEPPTRYAIRHLGLFLGRGVITLEAGADGTTTVVRWEEILRPVILPELGARLAAPVLRPIFQDDLHRFARLVETGSADD
jgi:Polyketide cyclase / dehydrase and lipid transport